MGLCPSGFFSLWGYARVFCFFSSGVMSECFLFFCLFVVFDGVMSVHRTTDQYRHDTPWHLNAFGSSRVSLWLQHISCQNAYQMASQCVYVNVQTAV